MASRGLRKTYFFFIWRLVRGETLIFVCFYGWVVCPLKTGLYKVNGRSARVTPGHTRPPGRLPTRKNTQKSKFLLSQAFKWKKIMFFVIPEMPYETFVMLYKNFLITLRGVHCIVYTVNCISHFHLICRKLYWQKANFPAQSGMSNYFFSLKAQNAWIIHRFPAKMCYGQEDFYFKS